MSDQDDDQRRDALLIEVMRQRPESREEMKARLKRERIARKQASGAPESRPS
jgi:hypothetical protein